VADPQAQRRPEPDSWCRGQVGQLCRPFVIFRDDDPGAGAGRLPGDGGGLLTQLRADSAGGQGAEHGVG